MQVPSNLPSLAARSASRETLFSRVAGSSTVTTMMGRVPRYQPIPLPKRAAAIIPVPAEPDDARITGATRSLSRRLLALNVRHDA